MDRTQLISLGLDPQTLHRAERLVQAGLLREVRMAGETRALALVDSGWRTLEVELDWRPGRELPAFRCSGCPTRALPCEHAAALLLYLSPARRAELVEKERGRLAARLLGYFERSAPQPREACLRLEVHLQPQADGPARLALRVGRQRMYVVRALQPFLEDYFARKGELPLGKNAAIDPETQCFQPEDEAVLRLLLDVARARALAQDQALLKEKTLALEEAQLHALLERLKGREFFLLLDGHTRRFGGVCQERLEARLFFSLQGEVIELEASLPKDAQPLTRDARYVRAGDRVYRLSDAQRTLLWPFFGRGERFSCRFLREEGEELLGEMLPLSVEAGCVELDDALRQQVAKGQLEARVRLDAREGQILARVEFAYEQVCLDPFRPGPRDRRLLLRDHAGERRVLDVLASYGFLVRPGEAHLRDAADCYRFLRQGVAQLEALAQVYATKALLGMRPRRQRPSGSLQRRGGSLWFYLELSGAETEDYQAIFQALRERRQYVRLRSGRFLTLDGADGWDEVARLVEESDEQDQGGLRFQSARAAYLPDRLDRSGLDVRKDEGVRALQKYLLAPPKAECPIPGLRPYQERGFHWLQFLAGAGLGGVLADDMGLGKTVQVLALFVQAHRQGSQRPNLVVAPTSLLYNWLYEVDNFAPELRALALSGQRQERQELCRDLEGVDVVVCSYAQLRRDVDYLSEMEWNLVVLDEAQQIKNAASVGAEAARRLPAKARFALTGTPMENHLGELWAIFDFVLPGYLHGRQAFLQRYGEGQDQEEMAARLRPFLMRREKKDVLRELPDKLEQTLACRLTQDQRRLYDAELLRAREMVEKASREGSLQRQNFQVLAALTRLRQICCHPALCFEGYAGGSGKLELVEQLLDSLLEGGHRVLLFSQFTSMLALIRESLERAGRQYLYLDGATPAKERLELADAFNQRKSPLFLISLRAGGFGLNLTAADSVIHFDPWWNPAVEDQATDRAHRIGQTKEVSVFKLIAQDTIEEKVLRLQREKKALIDAVVRPGEAVPEGLTAGELRALFD